MITRKGGRRLTLAAPAVLIALGLAGVGVWSASQHHAPQPTPTSERQVSQQVTQAQRSEPATPAVLPPSLPVNLSIPAIGVNHPLATVGLNPDGTLAVPSLADVAVPAWYNGSPDPGGRGPAVIVGHVDSASSGAGVFFKLGALKQGDEIDVSRRDETTARFRVTAVESVAKASFPTDQVYGNTPDAELRVITCGGQFDRATGHYLNNVIAFASLIA